MIKVNTHPANWQVFNDRGDSVSLDTDSSYVNSDIYDSLNDVVDDFIEKIEASFGTLSEDDKDKIRVYCDIHFSDRF